MALTAGPAQAERPELSRSSCAVEGGTFTVVGGARTCTVTTIASTTGPVATASATAVRPRCTHHRSCATALVEHVFTGTSQRSTTTSTVVVQVQRGHRPVTTATTREVLASALEPLTCVATPALDPSYGPLTVVACAELGLFVA